MSEHKSEHIKSVLRAYNEAKHVTGEETDEFSGIIMLGSKNNNEMALSAIGSDEDFAGLLYGFMLNNRELLHVFIRILAEVVNQEVESGIATDDLLNELGFEVEEN